MAGLAVLAAAGSCQEPIEQPVVETPVVELEYQDVTFNVAAPSGVQTKTTYGETVTFPTDLQVAVYVGEDNEHGVEGTYLPDVKQVITPKSDAAINTEWEVTLSLVKNYHYDIVFWAQRKDNAPYTIDWKEGKITADYKVAANDVTRDAFYHLCENYNFLNHEKDGASYKIALKRPFAQINLGASDYSDLVELYEFVGKTDSDLQTRIMTSASASLSVPSVLNVLTGVADTPAAVEFDLAYTTPADGSYNLVDPANDITVTGTDATGAQVTKSYRLVGTNYIFANVTKPENPTVDLTLTFAYNGRSFDLEVPNVPYARNYQTNILGNYFTSNAKFDVVIVPEFEKPDEYIYVWDGFTVSKPAVDEEGNYIIMTGAELAWVAQQVNSGADSFEGKTLYIASDIRLGEHAWTPIGNDQYPFKGTIEALAVTQMLTKSSSAAHYSISGLYVKHTEGPAGLFGVLNGTAVNVTLDNPVVKGERSVGAVAGKIFPDGLVEGASVKNGTVDGNHYVGGVVGYAYGSVKNNVVDGLEVNGIAVAGDENRDGNKVGGILGFHGLDDDGEISGNSVVTLDIEGKSDIGAIVGVANVNNVKGNDVAAATIKSTSEDPEEQRTAGVIAGRVYDNEANEVSVDLKSNGYNNTEITVNGDQPAPAKYFELEYNFEDTSIPAAGGEITIKVVSNVNAWTVTAPEGVEVEPAEGKETADVVFTFPANKSVETVSYELVFENKDAGCAIINCMIQVSQEGVAPEFSVEALSETSVIPAEGGEYKVKVAGNVPWTVSAPEGVTAEPASGEGEAEVVFTFPANELTEEVAYAVSVATEVEMEKNVYEFEVKQEAAVAAGPVVATVAEFLAAAEDDTVYQLTGMITSVVNTTYGNFYLKDATGEVYIYGLCSPEGAQKYWAESGAKAGDTITVQTVRASYNGSAQGRDAIFVELVPFVAEASEWGIVGDLTGWGSDSDITLFTTWKAENLFVAYNVEIASGAFKVRANSEWDDAKNYGLSVAGNIYADKYYTMITGSGSQNATPMAYGTYDVYFDLANERVALMTPGKEYAEAVDGGAPVVVIADLKNHDWGVAGSFQGWDVTNPVVAEEVEGDWAVAKNVTLANGDEFKFVADKAWTLSYGSACDVNVGTTYTTYENGQNMKFVGEAGAYNLYFSLIDAKFYMEPYISSTTVESVMADLGFANAALVENVTVDENVTLTFEKGGASTAPAYYTSGEAVRLYQNGAIMTVDANGRTITSIEITFANNMYYLAADSGEFTEEAAVRTWTGSAESVKFTCTGTDKNSRAYVNSIKVTYE